MRTRSKNKQTAWSAGKKARENTSDQVAIGFLFWSCLVEKDLICLIPLHLHPFQFLSGFLVAFQF